MRRRCASRSSRRTARLPSPFPHASPRATRAWCCSRRNAFGDVFAQTQLPARHIDTGTDIWAGQIARFLALGGDLRFDGSVQHVPHTRTLDGLQMQQTRVYLAASVIPDRLLVYADEQVAPGGRLNREA